MEEPLSIETLFGRASELESDAARAEFLDRHCGDRPGLRREVERLLADHRAMGSFLERPIARWDRTPGETLDDPGLALRTESPVPETIGPYRLLQRLGHGGMGVVYLAEQLEPIRRRVAIKLIRPDAVSEDLVARFASERRTLALMDHPHIARIFDVGSTDTGDPYLVMELVEGIPLTEFCHREGLSRREQLELFASLCDAVQHAHQKGIVHRDLKPSNVLVRMHDGRPYPKVIDFGVAKVIDVTGDTSLDRTRDGQLIGTPLYMSPEQAGRGAIDIDARSDIYSLGVMLYELLTGETPFDKQTLRTKGIDEIRRLIAEVDPPRPSQRTVLPASTRPADSGAKGGRATRRLPAGSRRELDWIVMRALEKDRERRYRSADAFGADIRRLLDGLPIEAGPPSAWYRLTKTLRRHRVTLGFLATVVGLLMLGTAVASTLAWRAVNAERAAERRYQLSRRAIDELVLPLIDGQLGGRQELDATQRELLTSVLSFYRSFVAEAADDPELRFDVAAAEARMASIEFSLGEPESADARFRSAVAILEEELLDRPDDARATAIVARAWDQGAGIAQTIMQPDEAIRRIERGLELTQRASLLDPNDPKLSVDVARLERLSALTLFDTSPERSESLLQSASDRLVRLSESLASTESDADRRALKESIEIERSRVDCELAFLYLETPANDRTLAIDRSLLPRLRSLLERFPNDPNLLALVWRAELVDAAALAYADQGEAAEKAFGRVTDAVEAAVAEYPTRDLRDLLAEALIRWTLAIDAGKAAGELADRGLPVAAALAEEFPDVPIYRQQVMQFHLTRAAAFHRDSPTEARRDFDEAVRLAFELSRDYPQEPMFAMNLALVASSAAAHLGTGPSDDPLFDPVTARELAERAVEIVPDEPDFLRHSARIAYRGGDRSKAIRTYAAIDALGGDLECDEYVRALALLAAC